MCYSLNIGIGGLKNDRGNYVTKQARQLDRSGGGGGGGGGGCA